MTRGQGESQVVSEGITRALRSLRKSIGEVSPKGEGENPRLFQPNSPRMILQRSKQQSTESQRQLG